MKPYIMLRDIRTKGRMDVDESASRFRIYKRYVPFRTDEQLDRLIDPRFWKSRLFGGLP
jgi:hypothetical protein